MSGAVPDDPAGFGIDTGRLLLCPLAESDASLFCDLYTDAEIMRFIGAPLSRRRALNSFRKALHLTRQRPVGHLFLAVVEKLTQQAIGLCSIELSGARAETGIMLGVTSRTHGRATEALGGAVDLAFAMLQLDSVYVRIAAGHRAAESLVRGLGFVRVADSTQGDAGHGRRFWSIDRRSWNHLAGRDPCA